MKRTQIQLKEETYERLRRRAFEEGRSIAGVIRGILEEAFEERREPKRLRIEEFTFVGSGRSGHKDISLRHDEALGEDF